MTVRAYNREIAGDDVSDILGSEPKNTPLGSLCTFVEILRVVYFRVNHLYAYDKIH